MDFKLTKELEMLRKAVREFAAKKIAPYAELRQPNKNM
jgi:alkylation response protein AidB-like acyl-CoA dehydrogenase